MYGLVFGVAMVAALGMADSRVVSDTLDPRVPRGWLQNDPADSLYRRARETLNRRDFRAAADLFAQIPVRFPRSGYAADALYWQAFALYRAGGERDLRAAMAALRKQREQYPKAATQGDAATLERRIQGELARRGDSEAAAAVAAAAESAIYMPTPPTPPTPPVPRSGRLHWAAGTACAEDDDDMKVAALNALLQMDEARARPVLRKVLARRDTGSVCSGRPSSGSLKWVPIEPSMLWIRFCASPRTLTSRTKRCSRYRSMAARGHSRRSESTPSGAKCRSRLVRKRSSGWDRTARRKMLPFSVLYTAGSRARS